MVQDLILKLVGAFIGLSIAGYGCYLLYKGREKRAKSDRLDDIETTPISGLQSGAVGVAGTAYSTENADLIKSPIEKKDALAAHVAVEEWKSGDNGKGWITIHEEELGVPISVGDGTGEVRVELPNDGGLDVEQTQTKIDSDDEPPARIQQYIENEPNIDEGTRHHHGPVSIGDRRRYSEGVIEPGEDVYVVGTAREVQRDWGEQTGVIDEPTESGQFILSDKSKAELVQETKQIGRNQLAIGGVIVLFSTLFTIIFWVNA